MQLLLLGEFGDPYNICTQALTEPLRVMRVQNRSIQRQIPVVLSLVHQVI